jgi:hypothetical protein
VIAVSEPFDKEPDWQEVPPNHVLIAPSSGRVEIVPIFPSARPKLSEERSVTQRVVARA